MAIDPSTVQVLHTEPWGDDVIGLVAFQAVRDTGRRQDCLFVYQATHKGMQWLAGRGGGGCGPAGGAGDPIRVGTGRHSSRTDGAWSHVSGTVYDPSVSAAHVTWEDGQEQQMSLVQGHFVVVRAGTHDVERVDALDADGATILTHERDPIAPGKQVP